MLMSFLSHLLSAWFAFLLPSYATFKALANRPASDQELHRWAMYWSVVGVFLAVEYAAEWILSWLPFYWETKTHNAMLMSFLSHLLSAWFAFLLPSYATFKALANRPASDQELHRWAMYWSVVGVFLAVEYAAEWILSWLPFYWETKTLFLLYLALPQTQGSTYIYNNFLQPFFVQNESDFDAGIVQVQKNTLAFVQSRIASLWEWLANTANRRQVALSSTTTDQHSNSNAPNPVIQNVLGLWQTYGNSALSFLGYPPQSSAGGAQHPDGNTGNKGPSSPPAASTGGPSFPEPQHVS